MTTAFGGFREVANVSPVDPLHVCSAGGLGQNTFYVDYRTEDGSANAGSDYHYSEGTLVFKPGDTRKEIKVSEETKVGPSDAASVLS